MRLVLLGGFLGAGKTTTMLAAAKALGARGVPVAVITNDQGDDLVDTQAAAATIEAADANEITGGCFCCRYDELADLLIQVADAGTEVVFAEAVGSCTDLAATVVAPLREYRPDLVDIAPLTVLVDATRLTDLGARDDDLGYLFDRQLAEADLVVLNKIDRLDDSRLAAAQATIHQRYPSAALASISAATGDGLAALLTSWTAADPVAARPVPVDYDRYAAAEAALGWLNQTWQLTARQPFRPDEWCRDVLERLRLELGPAVLLGHAKIAVQTPGGLTKASLVSTREPVRVDRFGVGTAGAGRVGDSSAESLTAASAVVNVRAAMPPAALEVAVAGAVLGALDGTVTAVAGSARAFAPGYPRPIHRMGSR